MFLKQKNKFLVLMISLFSLTSFVTALVPATQVNAAVDCNEINKNTSIIKATCADANGQELNPIFGLLILVLNILTGGIGIVAVGGLVYASILYASARDNAGQVSKAKELILNIVIGLVAYALMFSFLQFIIPGGVFNG